WLQFDGEDTMQLPDFSTHNGQSAKRRAEDQKRKQLSRSCPQSVRNESDKNRTREDKRREEEHPTLFEMTASSTASASPSRFAEFWSSYPRKVSKSEALKVWTKL